VTSLIYLDNNATTPVDPRVLDAMLPCFRERFGNAASRTHRFGWEAEAAVDQAREQLAALINAAAKEIVWTSGATESDNIALKGVAAMYRDKGRHIITQVTEHKAVLDSAKYLETQGCQVTYLPVDRAGLIDLDQLREAIRSDTVLVSIMFANNEIGTIQPIAEIGAICREKSVVFHTDATQAFGKVPIDVEAMHIDLLSCSGHKVYGPKGIGALYVRRKNPRVRCEPVIHGGGHERGMRSGTLNVPGIVGMGKASEIAKMELGTEAAREAGLRDRLWSELSGRLDSVYRNGHPEHCLPNTLNVSFAYVEGEALMMGFSNIAVSSGSACTSASLEPSYVLKALQVGDDLAHSSIRFSLGRFNTSMEIDQTVSQVCATVQRLRDLSPLYEMAKEGVDLKAVDWSKA
jgi:cysteine desulfurase